MWINCGKAQLVVSEQSLVYSKEEERTADSVKKEEGRRQIRISENSGQSTACSVQKNQYIVKKKPGAKLVSRIS